MKRNNYGIVGVRNEDGSVTGAVTGILYLIGDVVDPRDIKTVFEDGKRTTVFKTAEDVR